MHAYAQNKITVEQTEELFQYLNKYSAEAKLLLTEFAEIYESKMLDSQPLKEDISRRMQQSLLSKISTEAVIKLHQNNSGKIMRWAAAAAILLLVSMSTYLFINRQPKKDSTQNIAKLQPIEKDALPGVDGAVLTTASGKKILLDSAANGVVTREENTLAVKKGNQLIYNGSQETKEELESFNTLSTLKGRKFQLVLADGTKVWLDAASSITYPVVFAGKLRKVKVTGQLYFEVAKDKSKPFIVEAGGTSVQVFGTHFNVNAYGDESFIKTTLLEGSVRISGNNQSLMLKPGQQAVYGNENTEFIHFYKNKDVNLDEVIAWKSGLFQFENADLPTVLRQLARWYDMEIVYEGKMPIRKFGGKIGRDLNLSQVLKLLEKVQVRFRIEGNKLIVQS